MNSVIPISVGFVNVFLIKGKHSILIDAGMPKSGEKILKKIAAHGVVSGDISLIILTHCHYDHFGSIMELKEKTGAKVAIHKNDADYLKEGKNSPILPLRGLGKIAAFIPSDKRYFAGLEPDIVINKQMSLTKFGIKGKVISTPGHTPGSMSIILESGEAIVGDLIMGGIIRKKSPVYPIFGYDQSEVQRSIESVAKSNPTRIFPSHGASFETSIMFEKFGLNN